MALSPGTAGRALVALQFALIGLGAVLVVPARWAAASTALALAGAALGAWALAANRLGNFNIHPEPRRGGVLVTAGPYRWIRHPMYAALLLAMAGLATASTGAGWAAWAALAAVLAAKARLEERGLDAVHPGWAAYRARTAAIVPFLF